MIRRAVAALAAVLVLSGAGAPLAARAEADDRRTTARDAYIYGYPLMVMEITKAIANAASGGRFVHMLSGPTPPFRLVVAPNGDTRYSSAWVDLTGGPQVLHVPDAGGRYFVAQVMDAWTEVIADPTSRITGSSPADYAIVGPGWHGTLPPHVRGVRSTTNDVWILARTRALPGDTRDAITAIQQQYTLVPLDRFRDPTFTPAPGVLREPNVPTGPTPPSLVASMDAATFFAHLASALVANPPRPGDQAMVERLARIGIVPGRPFDAASLGADDRAALDAGVADARALLDAYDAPNVRHVNGWRWTHDTGRFATDYTYRAFVAKTLLAANLPEDAVYPETSVDANGVPLTGARRYALHFAAGNLPPAHAFWSLTMYSPDHYLVPNAIDRYTLRDAALRRNADGSIDVAIQHDAPAGDTTNWLPAPDGPFVVTLRMYWPDEAGIDGTYAIPAIQPLEHEARYGFQVVDERGQLDAARVVAGRTQDRRRVHGRDHARRVRRRDELAAMLREPERRSQQRLRGRRAQRDHELRLDRLDLFEQPRLARAHLDALGRGVDAPFAAPHELEVLDGVGDVDVVRRDAGRVHRVAQQRARRADERPALPVFLVAGLLADEHRLGARGSFAEHRLRGVLVEVAPAASRGRVAQARERLARGQKVGGGSLEGGHANEIPARGRG